MIPIGGGFSIPEGPQKAGPTKTPEQANKSPGDRLETTQTSKPGLIQPGFIKSAPSLKQDSPRPYPSAPEDLSKGSALANLTNKGANKTAAPMLPAGVAQCLTQLEKPPRAAEDANPTPDGWKLPANPNSTPLRPRDLFNIPVVLKTWASSKLLHPLTDASEAYVCSGRRNSRSRPSGPKKPSCSTCALGYPRTSTSKSWPKGWPAAPCPR